MKKLATVYLSYSYVRWGSQPKYLRSHRVSARERDRRRIAETI